MSTSPAPLSRAGLFFGWYSTAVGSGTTIEGGAQGMPDAVDCNATWGSGAVEFPRIQGADVAGRIVAVGESVPPQRVDERVLVDPWLRDPVDRADRKWAGYLGSEGDGSFAQFLTVPEQNTFPIQSQY